MHWTNLVEKPKALQQPSWNSEQERKEGFIKLQVNGFAPHAQMKVNASQQAEQALVFTKTKHQLWARLLMCYQKSLKLNNKMTFWWLKSVTVVPRRDCLKWLNLIWTSSKNKPWNKTGLPFKLSNRHQIWSQEAKVKSWLPTDQKQRPALCSSLSKAQTC